MRLSNKFHCFTGFGMGTLSPCNCDGEEYLYSIYGCSLCGKIGYCFGGIKKYGYGGTKLHDFENELEYHRNLKLFTITYGKNLTRDEIIDEIFKESVDDFNEYDAESANEMLSATEDAKIHNALRFFGHSKEKSAEHTMKVTVLYECYKFINELPYYVTDKQILKLVNVAPYVTNFLLRRYEAIHLKQYRENYSIEPKKWFELNERDRHLVPEKERIYKELCRLFYIHEISHDDFVMDNNGNYLVGKIKLNKTAMIILRRDMNDAIAKANKEIKRLLTKTAISIYECNDAE